MKKKGIAMHNVSICTENATSGITVIALVITIIVLLILAGITLLVMMQSGIITQANKGQEKTNQMGAKEKLELALIEAVSEKVTKSNYNEKEYLDSLLQNQIPGIAIQENIVIVDGYLFELDRTVPKIGVEMGKVELENTITIQLQKTIEKDYAKAIINTEIICNREITKIIIDGKEQPVPIKTDGKYILQTQVKENKTYTVMAYVNEKMNYTKIEITELTKDTVIKTKEDLIAFRDNVNKGATYEGRLVALENDIDLEGGASNLWVPIGDNSAHYFSGEFQGNNKVIKNMTIDRYTTENSGFFGFIKDAKIENVKLDNISIRGYLNTGGLVGLSNGDIKLKNIEVNGILNTQSMSMGGLVGNLVSGNTVLIENCRTNVTITNYANYPSNSTSGIGGLIGSMGDIDSITITDCHITSNLTSFYSTPYGGGHTGGLIGNIGVGSKSMNCNINKSGTNVTVSGKAYTGGFVGGYRAYNGYQLISTIEDCYAIGNVTGTYKGVGGFFGEALSSGAGSSIKINANRSYYTGTIQGSINSGTVGAFLGYNEYASVTTQNCYYNSSTAGVGESRTTAKGITTQQFQSGTLFKDWPTDIWNIQEGTYPTLKDK